MRVTIWSNVSRHMPGWPEAFEVLRVAGFEIDDPGVDDLTDDRASLLADADAILLGTNPLTRPMVEAAVKTKIVTKVGVGVDNVDLQAATDHGIRVCNTPGANSEAVADHALALALTVMRNVVALNAAVQRGKGWENWPQVGAQLGGATVAVLGTGSIGSAVIKRLVGGFSARVVAYDPHPNAALVDTYGVTYRSLDEVLRAADLVTIHVPLSPETEGLIGPRELDLMKPTAYLVNASRGGVVDEKALADAVRDGRLAGAGVDVFATEPALDGVLFGFDRIVLTPHVAGYSGDASLRSRVIAAENVVRAFEGTPQNQVNVAVATGTTSWRLS